MKKSGIVAEKASRRLGVPVLHLEDGFLRSIHPGKNSRPYSMVVDRKGIYYDSTRPSELEDLLNSGKELLEGIAHDVERAKAMILDNRLSKYNGSPDIVPSSLRDGDTRRVLVIDQTAGDRSVSLGAADPSVFQHMLQAAQDENPGATIYIKTHPEVSVGHKSGYLSRISDTLRIVLLRQPVNPQSLISLMDQVYTVTSTMGFEALLAGKKVTCFGIPWYSGWGVTDDRAPCPRRQNRRSVDELFAAAYFHYTTYLNPRTNTRGDIFDVIEWLSEQRGALSRYDDVRL